MHATLPPPTSSTPIYLATSNILDPPPFLKPGSAPAAAGLYARRHESAPANGLTGQMPFSLPHANPMEQSPNQLPQKLPILKHTHQREIEILSGVIYIHQPTFPAKCYCFTVAKTNAAIRLERVTNAQLACLQAACSA